jgi:hypothetical protein
VFQSYEFYRNIADGKISEYKIIDSDFIEYCSPPLLIPIIDIYERRNLPVVPNLIKFMMFNNGTNHRGVKHYIEWCKENSPKFAKYEKDIEKYLILL